MEVKSLKSTIIKIIMSSIGFAILALVLIFVAMMAYYLWQFKFADPEKLAIINSTYSTKFTPVNGSTKNEIEFGNIEDIIRSENPQKGLKNAAVTIVAFIDFECPYCQEDHLNIKDILDNYGPTVRLVIKHLPFISLHPNTQKVALASMCADEQSKFWEYYDKMYERQTTAISDEYITTSAANIGLDLTLFTKCLSSQKYKRVVEQDMADALRIGVRGTPTYIVGSDVIEGKVDRNTWDEIIIKNLK